MIENTQVLTGANARKKVLEGVNLVYDTLKLTLGPEGKNAILPRTFNRGPRVTNDGITIAELAKMARNEHVRQAAEAFMEGAKKTNQKAGDGTTTTTVIAGILVNENMDVSDIPVASLDGKGTHKGVRALRQEMKDAKDLVIEEIKKAAKPVKTLADLEKIAIVSIGKEDEETAKTIAKTVWEVARDGAGNFIDNYFTVTEGYKGEIETEVIKGMRFPAKTAHRAFLTNPEKFEMLIEDTLVLLTNYKFDNPFQFVGLIERLRTPKLAIFAPEFSQGVLNSMAATFKSGILVYPVKCPALRTEQLLDLGVYVGGNVIDKDSGMKLENVQANDLGFADRIVVKDTENREDAVLLGGKGVKTKRGAGTLVTERCEMLKKQLGEARNDVTKAQLEMRIANLSSAVGVIRVGATTDAEGLYLKLKVEDGVNACKAALEEGYVEGGGLCLKKIAARLTKNILTNALVAPYEQIQKNAGGNLDIGKDIIDPAKVVRYEIEHGVSVAATMLTVDISIPEMRAVSEGEGLETLARATLKNAYYYAKHASLLKENEDEAEMDRQRAFEEVMLNDRG